MSAVAKRYSLAWLASARDSGALDAVGEDLDGLRALLENSPEFVAFLRHPLIAPEDRDACLDAMFKGKVSKATLQFLHLLVLRERLADLPAIVDRAQQLWREEKGILTAFVVSAQELQKEQVTELKKRLAARTGNTIEMETAVDPALLGGFRLHIGDKRGGRVEDYSLASKLQTFKRNVINA